MNEQAYIERIKTLELQVENFKKLSDKSREELERFENKHGEYPDLINNYCEIRYGKQPCCLEIEKVLSSQWYKEVIKSDRLLTRHRVLVEMFTKCYLAEQGRH